MKKRLTLVLTILLFIVGEILGCFDTYLFINRGSMVYPYKKFVFETLGEYSFNSIKNPDEDTFLADFNGYYGVAPKFSLQIGVSSSEKSRAEFKIDEYGVRGVYNIYNRMKKYFVDIILAHHGQFSGSEMVYHFSVPNMIYKKDLLFVIHPTFEIVLTKNPNKVENTFGGHGGVFWIVRNSALIGLGAEYASPQSGSVWNKRLVEGEVASSLFLGGKIGDIMYIQSEFAKGLANSRDFGYAITLKILL